MQDRDRDAARGHCLALSKLNVAQVLQIWHDYHVAGTLASALALKNGVNIRTVRDVVERKVWRHVTNNLQGSTSEQRLKIRGTQPRRLKFKASEVLDIRRRLADGETITALAAEYGRHEAVISHILHRRTWKDL